MNTKFKLSVVHGDGYLAPVIDLDYFRKARSGVSAIPRPRPTYATSNGDDAA